MDALCAAHGIRIHATLGILLYSRQKIWPHYCGRMVYKTQLDVNDNGDDCEEWHNLRLLLLLFLFLPLQLLILLHHLFFTFFLFLSLHFLPLLLFPHAPQHFTVYTFKHKENKWIEVSWRAHSGVYFSSDHVNSNSRSWVLGLQTQPVLSSFNP